VTFSYRVLIHEGDEQAGRVPEAFIDYAKVEKSGLLNEELEKAIEQTEEKEEEAAVAEEETKEEEEEDTEEAKS